MTKPTKIYRLTTALLGAMLGCTYLPAQAEGAFAQLYAARPPAGSSFVRVINAGAAPLKVKIANGPEQTLSGDQLASSYAIVKGDTAFQILVNGKPVPAVQVKADSFTSLVTVGGAGAATFKTLDDSAGSSQDALKAEIRFYNLGADCNDAKLSIAPAGSDIVANVGPSSSKARAINPVKASLNASCGSAKSADVALPVLQPGDHYSLFLTGNPQQPQLRGQRGATDSYKP